MCTVTACLTPSVRPNMGLLLWARRAGDIDRLLRQRRAKASSAMYVGRSTQTCFVLLNIEFCHCCHIHAHYRF